MHQLNGPRAKVKRAQSQIVTLQHILQKFFERYSYRVRVAEFDRKTGRYNLRVHDVPPAFPDEWGVLIGEIAHDLRSALDGLAWQLALLNNPRPYERTAFPIYRVGRTKRKRGRRLIPHFWGKDDGLRHIQSIDRRYWARIEACQPYKGRDGGRSSPLFLLEELNNTDKHRLITVVTVVPSRIEMTGLWGSPSRIKRRVPLHLNAKIADVAPLPRDGVRILDLDNGIKFEEGKIRTKVEHEVRVDTTITPGILFGDSCNAVKRLPVIRTLQGMANEVSRIVESFAEEF